MVTFKLYNVQTSYNLNLRLYTVEGLFITIVIKRKSKKAYGYPSN